MPRNKFTLGATVDAQLDSTEHYVRGGQVKHAAETIMVTEFTPNWTLVSSSIDGSPATRYCKSHRPVVGFVGTAGQLDLPTIASTLDAAVLR